MFNSEGWLFNFDRLGGQKWADRSRWQWQTNVATPDPVDPPFALLGEGAVSELLIHVDESIITCTEAVLGDLAPGFMGEGDTVTVAESCTVTVADGGVSNLLASATESITLTESIAQQETAMIAFVTDPVTVAETLTFTGITLKGEIAEPITLTETITTAGRFVFSVTDAIVLTETTDQTCTPLRVSGDDLITLTDGPVLVMGEPGILYVALGDAITVAETLDAGENPILGTVAETITVDDLPYGRGGGLQPLSDDLVALTEDLGVRISPLRVAADDPVAVGESSDIGFNPMRVSPSETVTVTETHTLGVGAEPGKYLLTNDAHWTARCVRKERLINV